MKKPFGRLKKRKLTQVDYEFLMGTDLLKSAPKEAKNQLLACMAPLVVEVVGVGAVDRPPVGGD